jgi:YidC/Oxa1 family membrane protein insertase
MMQQLAPEMKKIAEKYKNDLQKRGEAQRELFAKHKYNPLGGCWMMFVQLPIFLGLYRGLAVDIDLRGQPLIPGIDWCRDLSAPDRLFYWGNWPLPDFLVSENGWLGPYLNLLPLITIGLFLVQQKLFAPPATDEQTRLQLKMMNFMTIFIGVMFFKVPAGLCVYFITSSLWGITERKLLKKLKPGAGPEKKTIAADKPAPKPSPKPAPKESHNGGQKSSKPAGQKQRRR